MRSMRKALFLPLLTACAMPGSAWAQFAGPLSPGAFEVTMGSGPVAQALREHEEQGRMAQPRTTPQRFANPRTASPPQAMARPANPAVLNFTSTPARRRANFDSMIARMRQNDPAGATNLAAEFASRDMVGEMARPLGTDWGLRVDNVADAYTTWWITAWSATQGHNRTPPRPTVLAVRKQVEGIMLSTGGLNGASDAQKQEMADGLLLQAALIDGSIEQNKTNPQMLRTIGGYVSKGAQAMGVDLPAMRLTPTGFAAAR